MKKVLAIVMAFMMAISFVKVVNAEGDEVEQKELNLNPRAFTKYSGIVKEISEESKILVEVPAYEDEKAKTEMFLNRNFKTLDLQTGKITQQELKIGDEIIFFVRNNSPVALSMPAIYSPSLVCINPHKNYSVDMDLYEKNEDYLVGVSNRLIINSLEKCEGYSMDEEKINLTVDKLNNEQLIVLYTISTRSLPPQTNPLKIFVYKDPIEDQMDIADLIDAKNVGGKTFYGIRQNIERLGYNVSWDRETNTVIIESPNKTAKVDLKSNTLIIDKVHKIETFVENNKSYVLDSAMKLLYDYLK